MSQARKIYGFLASVRNAAADETLLQGWRRAEEPYRTALLETILDRGQGLSTSELIGSYHEFSPGWQNLLIERADSLLRGLRSVEREGSLQSRLNCLEIIKRGRCYRLADVTVVMLRDRQRRVAERAGAVLLDLARRFGRIDGYMAEPSAAGGHRPAATDRESARKRVFLSALDSAVRNYKVHRRPEVVLAAMHVVPADVESFWRNQLEAHHQVGQTVRLFLVRYDWPELAGFCLSALKNDNLRPIAARAIATHQRKDFVAAIGREFVKNTTDEPTRRGLNLVRQAQWLNPTTVSPGGFSA